jgi:hypothetical protein
LQSGPQREGLADRPGRRLGHHDVGDGVGPGRERWPWNAGPSRRRSRIQGSPSRHSTDSGPTSGSRKSLRAAPALPMSRSVRSTRSASAGVATYAMRGTPMNRARNTGPNRPRLAWKNPTGSCTASAVWATGGSREPGGSAMSQVCAGSPVFSEFAPGSRHTPRAGVLAVGYGLCST